MLAHIFSLARGIWRLSKVYHTQAENPTVIQKSMEAKDIRIEHPKRFTCSCRNLDAKTGF